MRPDASTANDPVVQAEDVHRLITEVGGPVDLFASSGGAITALALVTAYPDDVVTLVAHEPPLLSALPDADCAYAAEAAVQEAYHARGRGHGMAAFIALTRWQGEFTAAYADQPLPDPAASGMPADDDGTRTDPLLSGVSNPVTGYRPDWDALRAAPTRIVIAYGVESVGVLTGRTSVATAAGARSGGDGVPQPPRRVHGRRFGYAGQPEAFATRLHEVLDQN